MSLARQPHDDPPRRPTLRVVSSSEPVELSSGNGDEYGSPARGMVWGLGLAVVGFWLPLAAIVGRLALK